MDLFVINRYEGEDDTVKENESESKVNHLEKLLSKIEEKKRIAEQNQLQSLLTKGKIKKRKKKHDHLSPENKTASKQDNTETEKSKEKRKKRKHADQLAADDKKNEASHNQLFENETASEEVKAEVEKSKEKRKRKKYADKLAADDTKDEATPEALDGKFTILGDNSFGGKKPKVDSALPHWLAHPSVVSVDLRNLTVSVNDIPQLNSKLIKRLKMNGITHFFPVQHQVIPWLLEIQNNPPQFWPRDVCVSAPTGSGKTLAFVLPIIQALHDRTDTEIRALVVVPVQALALQVSSVFKEYTSGTFLKVACTTGAEQFQDEQTKLVRYSEGDKAFHSCVDILVTTPGRLVDHLQLTVGFSLRHLKYLVIDEADRVLKSMQQDWLYHVQKHVSQDDVYRRGAPPLTIKDMHARRPPPQKLLFSATLTQDPEKLKMLGLFQPRLFSSIVEASHEAETSSSFVRKISTPAELKEQWLPCEPTVKPLYLLHLLKLEQWNKVLIFANSKVNVHRLTVLMKYLLDGEIKIAEMSNSLAVKDRRDVLKQFSMGKINILVSSDSLARGIDIPGVECVILYNAPQYVQNYVHQIGRTGRAGRLGTAITLVEPRQVEKFKQTLSQAGKEGIAEEIEIDTMALVPLEEKFKEALSSLKWQLEDEAAKKKYALMKKKKTAAQMLRFRKKLGLHKKSKP